FRAGLRGERVAWPGRPQEYACGHRRTAQPGDQCEAHEPRDESEIPRFGRYSVYQSAGRIWQAPRLRNREVGQGDPGRQHQGGVIRAILAEYSVTPAPRIEVWGALFGIAGLRDRKGGPPFDRPPAR